ncbi:MAG TPA: hypothetical protein VGN99_01475, partial [Steroidobacteraceae bacterium]|nr:hypothetical protein [Steroidobacteraceae bacterium]
VTDDSVDPLDAGGGEDGSELISNGCHENCSEVMRVPRKDIGNLQQIRKKTLPRAPPKSS